MKLNQSSDKSSNFDSLLNVHTKALEENSKSVVEILELLAEKNLSFTDKKKLKKIKNDIKTLDNKVDSLGVEKDEEEWW